MEGPITPLIEILHGLRTLPKAARRSFGLEAGELAAAYAEQRDRSPRRAQGYFSTTRYGITSSGDASRRTEEHLAVGLFLRGELSLPNGEPLKLLDYQFPLKSVQADTGIGKVDLLALCQDGALGVVELKVAGNREDCRIALLEGLVYAAIIEANIVQIAAEASATKNVRILQIRPKLFLIAPPDYWSRDTSASTHEHLNALTRAVASAIPIEISLLSLNDAGLNAMGLHGRPPQVTGHAYLSLEGCETSPATSVMHVSQLAYREDLHLRFWNYRRTAFASDDDLFDPRHADEKTPPVFRRQFAEHNLLLPPIAEPGVRAAITAMISPVARHRWFTSMASSQALAQSVFGSLAAPGRLDALEGLAAEDGYPAFFAASAGYTLELEHPVSTLGEPRPTSLDAYFHGPRKVAVEVKFSEAEFGSCSRPRLRPKDPRFDQDHCDGSFSVQRNRQARCSLSERGILYWQFIPSIFTWSADEDHWPCPLAVTYQLVRNVLAIIPPGDAVPPEDSGHVLVVYDERNPTFRSGGNAHVAWWLTIRALRFPRLLRRVSWQRLALHLRRYPDLAWLTTGLEDKYGIW